jgi:hypothetical protein
MRARSTRIALTAVAVVVVLSVVWVLVDRGSGKGSSSASPTSKAPSRSSDTTGATTDTTAGPPTTAVNGTTTSTLQPIPLQVSATSGRNLRDGQSITVTVTADKGSEFFGMDARLCAATPAIGNFFDYTPDPAGHCILHPLSSDSDAFVEAAVGPPHLTGTLTFRVGVGTSRFKTEDLQDVAVTCGPGHPCQLVVRLQYPYGFGFRAFPVTYAG